MGSDEIVDATHVEVTERWRSVAGLAQLLGELRRLGQVGVVHCLLVAGELDDLDVGVRPVAVGGENSAMCLAPAFGLSHPLVYDALDLCRMSRSDLDDLDEGRRCSSMSGRTATSRVPYVTRHPRIGSGSLPFLWKLGLLTRKKGD